MGITFHCEHCDKKIEAPDNAGGKWGKCPSCHNKLYVPDLNPKDELLLAPIDETEEMKKKQLLAETFQLTLDILGEKEESDADAPAETDPEETVNDRQLTKDIMRYLRQMVDGDLDRAQETAELIIPHGAGAVKILNDIALADVPGPELDGIPRQVLSGLIKTLRNRII